MPQKLKYYIGHYARLSLYECIKCKGVIVYSAAYKMYVEIADFTPTFTRLVPFSFFTRKKGERNSKQRKERGKICNVKRLMRPSSLTYG